jgi:hypothetical protein
MKCIKRKSLNLTLVFLCLAAFLAHSERALAVSELQVRVEVIKAERDSKIVDPRLEGLVKELGPVLNYTGFSLLKAAELNLQAKKKQEVILSPDRLLQVEFLGLDQGKARLSVVILEKKEESFRTTLVVVDKGTVLIGGPPHEGGVLLLRISAEFQE